MVSSSSQLMIVGLPAGWASPVELEAGKATGPLEGWAGWEGSLTEAGSRNTVENWAAYRWPWNAGSTNEPVAEPSKVAFP